MICSLVRIQKLQDPCRKISTKDRPKRSEGQGFIRHRPNLVDNFGRWYLWAMDRKLHKELQQLVVLKDLEAFEDVGSFGTPAGIVSGTCNSCKSSWRGFMKARLKHLTTKKVTTTLMWAYQSTELLWRMHMIRAHGADTGQAFVRILANIERMSATQT